MKSNLVAFGTGVLFAIGLAISGMTVPSKIIGFLDITGAWDASLAFVMIGAIAVHFILHRVIVRRPSPLFDVTFHVPTRRDIDVRIIAGAALFGVGWGLGGFCPGPGLVSAGSGSLNAIVFVGGMTIGMLMEHAAARASRREPRAQPTP